MEFKLDVLKSWTDLQTINYVALKCIISQFDWKQKIPD